jgi:regulator of protease activity HflC (stomatin/prohibitin superfamily)
MRYKAEAEADKILAKVAGDEAAALRMALAIRQMSEYSELQRVSGNRDAFARKLLECIATLTHDVSSLNEEIARERLLGRFREGPGSKVELRQALEAYEKELNAAQAEFQAGKTPDFTTKVAQARETADKLLEEASGQPATLVATAEGSRWTRELTERARAEAFQRELLAYEAAPEMYLLDRWLDVWDENLPNLTKYVLGVDRNKVQLWLNAEKEPTGVERSAFATEESSGGGSK